MLDTVIRTTVRPLSPATAEDLSKGLDARPGWKFWFSQKSLTPGAPSTWTLEGTHEATGLYIHGMPYEIRGWRASLPRVLHGFNGTQLKSDNEIQQSFARVHSILNEISTGPSLTETFRRLDIAINLSHLEPQRIVSSLRNARHSWIRKETEHYSVGSIRYPGTEVVFTAYWKLPAGRSNPKRKAWRTPQVLRLELQLKSTGKIAEFLDVDEPTISCLPPLAFIYEKFRDFMLGFPRCSQLDTPCSMAAVMALCESRGLCLPGGETVMDWHARSVGASGHSKMRTKVAKMSAQFLDIDWAEILPGDSIPETVDVSLDGTTNTVPAVPIVRP